ncbi:MAG: hypothetical protein MJ237_09685 [bacterium]|nr:hypothetical protein [bacterium]
MTPKYSEKEGLAFARDVMNSGDEFAYQQLKFSPVNQGPYSFIMANKYNSATACWNMYRHIYDLFEENNIELDSMSESIAIGYLKRGADLGDKLCIEHFISIYKRGGNFFSADSMLIDYYKRKLHDIGE